MTRRALISSVFALGILAALHSQEAGVRFQGKYIFSDGSEYFRSPSLPMMGEAVVVRVRVKKGMADEVVVHYGDGNSIEMTSGEEEGFYETFAAQLPPVNGRLFYYYGVSGSGKTVYHSRRGMEIKRPPRAVQFQINPGLRVPAWMEGAVLYQIFTDRFYNGDPSNDVVTNEYLYDNHPAVAREWGEIPDSRRTYSEGSDRTREFYGGDLQGIIDKLDYLADLGVEGIYLNPVFVSPSNHKYDTQDYYHIDPHFGVIADDAAGLINPADDPHYGSDDFNNASRVNRGARKYIQRTTSEENLKASDELFKTLIDEAHARNIRVILDGVFNHAGSFNRWFDREHIYLGEGAYESAGSPYRDYFQFNDQAMWPDNESYNAWYGFKTLPKLNLEENAELEQAILDVAARWVGPEFGADGWRLDVAAELGDTPAYNHEFWKKFRSAVKEVNPEAVILAEVYGDSSSWLGGDEWDTIMNYDAFFDPVSHFLTGLEKHSWHAVPDLHNNTDSLVSILADRMARIPWESLNIAMNQLSNHDHSRFYTRTTGYVDSSRRGSDISLPEKADDNLNPGMMREGVILQMFMPGAPTLYYGEEAGLPGLTDPDSRRTFPWGGENLELTAFYRDIIALRREFTSLKGGSYLPIPTGRQGVFAFMRWNGNDSVLVAVNNGDKEVQLTLSGDMTDLPPDSELVERLVSRYDGYEVTEKTVKTDGNGVTLSLPAYGGKVLGGPSPAALPEIDRPEALRFTPLKDGVRGSFQVKFDRPMNQRGIIEALSVEPERRGRYYWNGNTVTFVPSTAMASGTYTVRITPELSSRQGNFSLPESYVWEYRVK